MWDTIAIIVNRDEKEVGYVLRNEEGEEKRVGLIEYDLMKTDNEVNELSAEFIVKQPKVRTEFRIPAKINITAKDMIELPDPRELNGRFINVLYGSERFSVERILMRHDSESKAYEIKGIKSGKVLLFNENDFDFIYSFGCILQTKEQLKDAPTYIVTASETSRPSEQETFMDVGSVMAKRATCDRLNVGAVIVKNGHIIAEGFNGSISGHKHCDEVGHLMYENGCKRTIHAEMNALLYCAREGIATKGATMYVTHYPCPDCMKHINQAGITEVVYEEHYKHRYENNFHEGMKVQQFKR